MPPASFLNNHILRTLPPATLREWQRHGDVVDLRPAQILSTPGDKPRWTHFPLTVILVWINLMENGASTAVALVGREGASSPEHQLGQNNHLMVLCPGQALRIPTSMVSQGLQQWLPAQARYEAFLKTQVARMGQTAACNRHHALEQQLVRLLLTLLDRSDGPTLQLTHELMANMLGVRREGVTYAASLLQRRGLIGYSRGRITIVDKSALTQRVCECYHLLSRLDHLREIRDGLRPEPSGYGSRSG